PPRATRRPSPPPSAPAERNVVAHRAAAGRALAGFVLSRTAAGEAEILSIAVTEARRGRGLGAALLRHHLGRLMALGVTAVFLERSEEHTSELQSRANL